jgi:hypothetical protein
MSEFQQLKKELEGFPFVDFHSLQSAHANGLVELGAASDHARHWLTVDENAPAFPKLIAKLHTLMLLLFPAIWLAVAFIEEKLLWGLLAVLTLPLYLVLRPMTVNLLGAPVRLVIWFGYACVLVSFFDLAPWTFAVGLTIVAPWLANKITYSLSSTTALNVALVDEASFLKLFKWGVVVVCLPNGRNIRYTQKVK